MKKILPLRDYSEHDVVNFFALNTANNSVLDTGAGDAGVIVKVENGAITNDAVQYVASAYLGKVDYPYVGRNQYPEGPLKVSVAGSGEAALGITLYETALEDENGEKLLYYRQKALENQIVLSGQAVPVVKRGTFMLDQSAFVGSTVPAPASSLVVGSDGRFEALGTGDNSTFTKVGQVLATGIRVAGATADLYAGAAGATGRYALVSINF